MEVASHRQTNATTRLASVWCSSACNDSSTWFYIAANLARYTHMRTMEIVKPRAEICL